MNRPTKIILIVALLCGAAKAATVTCGPNDNAVAKAALCKPGDTFQPLSGTTITGPLKTVGVLWLWADNSTGITINNCTIDGTGIGNPSQGGMFYLGAGCSNCKIVNCAFQNVASTNAIFGYWGNSNTLGNNTFANCWEAIHTRYGGNANTVTGNTAISVRWNGIELQDAMTNLTVSGNYVSVQQPTDGTSHMAYSIATGNGNNISVTGNIGVSDSPVGAGCEIMGTNAGVTGNVFYNFAQGILNGAQGSQLTTNSNKVYGGVYVANDNTTWPIAKCVSPEAVLPLTGIAPPLPGGSVPPPVVTPPPAPTITHTIITTVTVDGAVKSTSTQHVYSDGSVQ